MRVLYAARRTPPSPATMIAAIYKLHAGRLVVLQVVALVVIGLLGLLYRHADQNVEEIESFQRFEQSDSLSNAMRWGQEGVGALIAEDVSGLALARAQLGKAEHERLVWQLLFVFGGIALALLMGVVTWVWASAEGAAYRRREAAYH
jgi:hypothetical protein